MKKTDLKVKEEKDDYQKGGGAYGNPQDKPKSKATAIAIGIAIIFLIILVILTQ